MPKSVRANITCLCCLIPVSPFRLDEQDSLVYRRMVIECQEDTLHDRHRGDRPGSSVRCSSSPRDTEAAEAVAP